MSNKKNNLHNFNRVIFIFCCVFLSILFSYYVVKYVDFKGQTIDDEKSYGDIKCDPGERLASVTSTGQPVCFTCGAGQTGNGYTCSSCPAGQYCPGGTASGYKCQPGTYSQGRASSCSSCPAGQYCPASGMTSGVTCPNGYFCPAGSVTPQPCPTGTTSSAGAKFASECVSINTSCDPGQYKENGTGKCITCQSGHYCDGKIQIPCPAGKYQPNKGASSCLSCDPGTYQSQSGQASCNACSAGKYQPNKGASSCSSCSPGTYSHRGASSCSSCLPGTYQSQSGQASCNACPDGKYQEKSGQTSCDDCNGNVILNRTACTNSMCSAGFYNGEDGCTKCDEGFYCQGDGVRRPCDVGKTTKEGAKNSSECSISQNNNCSITSVSTNNTTVSYGTTYTVSVAVSGDGCSSHRLYFSASNATVSPTGTSGGLKSNHVYTFTVRPTTGCVYSKATARLSNNKTSSASSVYVLGPWEYASGEWVAEGYVENSPHSEKEADAKGAYRYYSNKDTCSSNPNKKCYKSYAYRRGCAPPPDGGEVPHKACYKEKSSGKLYWGEYSTNNNYEKTSYSESECLNLSVDDCVDSVIVPSKEDKKTSCNGNVTFNGTSSKSCEVKKNPYYKISCIENLSTVLNPELTDTIKTGLGFNYDIKVSSKRSCSGIFYLDEFKKAYDIVKQNLNRYPSGTADYNTYLNKKKDLEEMVDFYNKWVSTYNLDDVKATLEDHQLKKKVSFIEQESSSNINRGKKKTIKTHQLNISGITNPIDFEYEENLSKKLILPLAYYNIQTNSITYTNCRNCTELSNQYFISNSPDYIGKDYKYTVNVTGLGYNKKWSVTTNDCSLKVKENTKIYRPTDLDDPFLVKANPERETGENWLNEIFDFTKVIENDIWSQKPLYEFNITLENVKAIKKNNSELGANAYIGTDCKFLTSKNKYYCEFLRNKKYFQYSYIYSDN